MLGGIQANGLFFKNQYGQEKSYLEVTGFERSMDGWT